MKALVTGGAGFVGSHLVEALVRRGDQVKVLDDLSTGSLENLSDVLREIEFIHGDVRDLGRVTWELEGQDVVYHLAANTDNLYDPAKVRTDLEHGTIATWNVLEGMRRNRVERIVFASSASVYSHADTPRRETDLVELPRSLYAASKLAGESLISAWCAWFGTSAWIYRFGNVVGPRIRHGVHWALLRKLAERPAKLEVLGDGSQLRPFVHVTDLVAGIFAGVETEPGAGVHVYNLAPSDVTAIATVARQCLDASPRKHTPIAYTGGPIGWTGDVNTVRLNPSKIGALGFWTRMSSDEASWLAAVELAREIRWPS